MSAMLTILPELEVDDTGVSVSEGLIRRYDTVKKLLITSQRSYGSKQPTIT